MRNARFNETETVRVLKEVGGGRQVEKSAASTGYRMRPTTTEERSTAVTMSRTFES